MSVDLVCPQTPSGLSQTADTRVNVTVRRYGPCVDGSGLARRIFTLQQWSEQPCVRPVCAVHVTAGHCPPRIRSRSFEDAMAMWVVLIAGSTGAALRADRPSNRYVTPAVRSRSRRESG